ncbi:TetR family transcriptional regulator [Comamonas thiooxydans]|uniref:TetR/AcrR family transcriptional regulator n=1 Tax=Comamonas thiooxydans TaxID=363952 RepID=UPI0020CB94A1|nr:TetR/AcrR family transcriptional regulator [Comamonas thiooxydans]BDR07227.1 TetR family transcriptional regulator [Comamonas thiooxydans]
MNIDAKMDTTQEDDHVTSLSFAVMRKTASDVPVVMGKRAALRQAEQAEVTSSGVDVPRAQARQRMLYAAEKLFAQHGYAGTSLRAVMAEADVDTGAIHYHFKNKLGLLKALFEERVQLVNAQREALLAQLEQRHANEPPSIEEVLRAFIAPALHAAYGSEESSFNRVAALCSVDPLKEVREVVFKAYDKIALRFALLLRRVTPHLSETEFQWRLECMYGAMMYIRSDNGRVSHMLNDKHRSDPVEKVIEQLIAFTAAGFAGSQMA